MSSVTSCIGNLGAGPSASCLSQSQWAVLRGRGREEKADSGVRRFDRLWPAGNRTMPVSRLQLGAGRQAGRRKEDGQPDDNYGSARYPSCIIPR